MGLLHFAVTLLDATDSEKSHLHILKHHDEDSCNQSYSSARMFLHRDSALSQKLLFPTCPSGTILALSASFCRTSLKKEGKKKKKSIL